MCVPGAIAAMSAAMMSRNPADAARAPEGATKALTVARLSGSRHRHRHWHRERDRDRDRMRRVFEGSCKGVFDNLIDVRHVDLHAFARAAPLLGLRPRLARPPERDGAAERFELD